MLHVGLEHVGSLHVSYTCLELLVSWQLNDYRLSLVFKSGLNLNLRITVKVIAMAEVYLYDLSLRRAMDAARFFSLVSLSILHVNDFL